MCYKNKKSVIRLCVAPKILNYKRKRETKADEKQI